MPKLYTKTGDTGTTSLYDMRRLPKNHSIFEALGRMDTLSADIGMLLCFLDGREMKFLREVQETILDLCSLLATWKNRDKLKPITEEDVKKVEIEIDYYEAQNESLKEFILAGGINMNESLAHKCRTSARDAERALWNIEFPKEIKLEPEIYQYVNRLSDYFFAFARYLGNGGYKRGTIPNSPWSISDFLTYGISAIKGFFKK